MALEFAYAKTHVLPRWRPKTRIQMETRPPKAQNNDLNGDGATEAQIMIQMETGPSRAQNRDFKRDRVRRGLNQFFKLTLK